MKAVAIFLSVVNLVAHTVLGEERQPVATTAETVAVSSAVTYQTALARADVAIAKSLLNERLLKGEVGETIRDQTVGRYLHRSGQWLNVSPRLGRQGIDHISMQFDNDGNVSGLLVEETKFGSSQLGVTKDGIQFGSRWTNKRLEAIGSRYAEVARQIRSGHVQIAKRPSGLASRQSFPVPLRGGKEAHIWRSSSQSGWFIDCHFDDLQHVPKRLDSMATYVKASASGQLGYEKLLNQVKIDGDILKVNILDATRVDATGGSLGKLPVKAELKLPIGRAVWASDAIAVKLAEDIRRQMPHLEADEAKHLAQGIQSTAKTAEEALSRTSFTRFTTLEASKAGTVGVLVVVPLEIALQLFNGDTVDWSRVAGVGGLAGASAAIGNAVGNYATLKLMEKGIGYSASVATAEILGLRSASRFANAAGGVTGGGVTAILFAYGGWGLGYYDLQTANRSAVAGVAGVGAGAAASAVTLGLISTYATAGTGVAISTLSGASATSASLAWVGGGTVASGGFGVAGGTVILGTGVGIVLVGVTAAVIYGFQLADEHQETIRLTKTIEYLSGKQTFAVPEPQVDVSR